MGLWVKIVKGAQLYIQPELEYTGKCTICSNHIYKWYVAIDLYCFFFIF